MFKSTAELFRLAHEHVINAVPDNTMEYLETLVHLEPHNLDYLLEYAVCMHQMAFTEELVSIEAQVKEIAPDSAEHFLVQALTLDSDGLGGVLPLVNRALELRPDFPHALYLRADVHEQQGESAQAAVDLDRCLELEPAFSMAELRAGMIKKEIGLVDEAFQHLLRYLSSPFSMKNEWLYKSIALLSWKLADLARISQEQKIFAMEFGD